MSWSEELRQLWKPSLPDVDEDAVFEGLSLWLLMPAAVVCGVLAVIAGVI